MFKQTIPPDKIATKQQTKPQPTVDPLAGMAGSANEALLFGENNHFSDCRLSAIQRQVVAQRIGNTQGNGCLQNILLIPSNSRSTTPLQRKCNCANRTPTSDLCDECKQKRVSQPLEIDSSIQRQKTDTVMDIQRQHTRASLQRDVVQREDLYNITIGNQTLQNATAAQVIRQLRFHYRIVSGRVESGREMHQFLINLREDQWFVGAISEMLGGVQMPSIGIWVAPRVALNAVQETLNAGLIEPTIRNLQRAERLYQDCHRQVIEYRDGSISGSETSITVLKVTAAVGAVAATAATGGLAAGGAAPTLLGIEAGTFSAGLLSTSTAVGVTGGAYGVTQELAGQASEYGHGLRQDIDIAAILRRGTIDAVTNFVGAFTGGALSQYMNRFFGSYLSRTTPELLEELGRLQGLSGPMPRDFFLTQGQRFISEFLSGIGTTPLTSAIQTVLNRLTGGSHELPSPSQFARQVFDEMVQGGAIQLFIGVLTHTMGTGAHTSPLDVPIDTPTTGEHGTTRSSESPHTSGEHPISASDHSSELVTSTSDNHLPSETDTYSTNREHSVAPEQTTTRSPRTVRESIEVQTATGETHELKLLSDGGIIRCSQRCLELSRSIRERSAKLRRLLSRGSDVRSEAANLTEQAHALRRDANAITQLQRTERAARGVELLERAAKLEQEMASLEALVRRGEVLREFVESGASTSDSGLPLTPPATSTTRLISGEAHGGENLPNINGRWLIDGRVGQFPGQIAKRMNGMHFENWRSFREHFWKMVADDPQLSIGWKTHQLSTMRSGRAPHAGKHATGGGANAVYQLNHILPLEHGGGMYDLDNIEIVSPQFHEALGREF